MSLDVNDCDVHVNFLLLQMQPEVASNLFKFFSRSLTDMENIYEKTQMEYIATVIPVFQYDKFSSAFLLLA